MKFLKKHKDNRIKKLKTRVVELEEENEGLRKEVFQYRLRKGKTTPKPQRSIMKVMGNHGTMSSGPK